MYGVVLLNARHLHFLLEQAVEERLDGRERLLAGHARLQPREDVDPAAPAVVHVVPVRRHLRLEHHRDANAGDGADVEAVEAGLGHTNHRKRIAVDHQSLPDNRRVGAKPCCANSRS